MSNVQTFLTISGVESEDFGQALVGSPVDPATNVDRIPIPAGLADSVRRARERAYSIKQLR